MKQSLNLAPTQSLTMTPALQQALKMLQMSTIDLRTEIQAALESNLMLEADDGGDYPGEDDPAVDAATDADTDTGEVNVEWEQIYEPGVSTAGSGADGANDWQDNISAGSTLADYLHWQADMAPFTPIERAIAAVIIDDIGASGLINDWPALAEQIMADFDVGQSTLDTVLTRIQSFDPPGVAARDLAECIDLQLEQIPDETPGLTTALAVISKFELDALVTHTPEALAISIEASQEDMDAALVLIRSCRPDPGEPFQQTTAEPITPEVEVRRTADGWQVTLNTGTIPRVRLNERYLDLVKRGDQSESQATLKAHLKEARFFLNSLKSRNETLLEVAECLVRSQRAFLEYGPRALKPMVLKEVADRIGVHESTISRTTANKYMQTPRGIIELRNFFSSSVATTDGGTVSGTAIQAMLKTLVTDEAPREPLSDNQLAELLKTNEGVCVARRTVAKYREALGIPPSRARRKI